MLQGQRISDDHRVQIWIYDEPTVNRHAASLQDLLDDEEAEIYHRSVESRKFEILVSRAALRLVLSESLDQTPGEVRILRGKHRKPSVAGNPIYFNASHSEGVAIIATSQHPVGVDIEKIRGFPLSDDAISSVFSAAEQVRLKLVDPSKKEKSLFKAWTSKEAVAKLFGRGLDMPLDEFSVCVDPTLPPSITESGGWDCNVRLYNAAGNHRLDGFAAVLASSSEVREITFNDGIAPNFRLD